MTTLAEQMDELRIATGRTKALADVAVSEYDNASWGSADPEQVERVAYMLEAVASAATTAVGVVDRLHTVIADLQPAGSDGDRW
jgi:hypothetical protein